MLVGYDLNTSYVLVQQPLLSVNLTFPCNLNTSYVLVQHSSPILVLQPSPNLNTSYVLVQPYIVEG